MPEECSTWTVEEAIKFARDLSRGGHYVATAATPGLIATLLSVPKPAPGTEALDSSFLQARALASEQADQRGRLAEAKAALEAPAEIVLQELKKGADGGPDIDLVLIEAQAEYILRCAISQHRQKQDAGAHALIESSERYVTAIEAKRLTRLSITALLQYWRGRCAILRQEYETANQAFQRAMQSVSNKLQYELDRHQQGVDNHSGTTDACPRCRQESVLAQYRIGSTQAFGFARLAEAEGRIDNAIHALIPARTLLLTTGDSYRKGYAATMLGSFLRIKAGLSRAGLEQALQTLKTALPEFKPGDQPEHEHIFYEGWVHHRLSEVYDSLYLSCVAGQKRLQRNNSHEHIDFCNSQDADAFLTAAEQHNSKAREIALQHSGVDQEDLPLTEIVLLMQSKLLAHRGQFPSACEVVSQLIHRSQQNTPVLPLSREYLALGEVKLAQSRMIVNEEIARAFDAQASEEEEYAERADQRAAKGIRVHHQKEEANQHRRRAEMFRKQEAQYRAQLVEWGGPISLTEDARKAAEDAAACFQQACGEHGASRLTICRATVLLAQAHLLCGSVELAHQAVREGEKMAAVMQHDEINTLIAETRAQLTRASLIVIDLEEVEREAGGKDVWERLQLRFMQSVLCAAWWRDGHRLPRNQDLYDRLGIDDSKYDRCKKSLAKANLKLHF